MLVIDGSLGEGGGQILRTSLALAAITRTPVRIERIRAKRPKPGLQRQHLMAVQAAARVCDGALEGAALQSTEIVLIPRAPLADAYVFDIGSAGSAAHVLQTVLPILLHADGPSTVRIRGGTHNPLAPPIDFLQESFLPVLSRMGAEVTLTLERHGFYPAGGGAIVAEIAPWRTRVALDLRDRGDVIERRAEVLIANLPSSIATREAQVLGERLALRRQDIVVRTVAANGPGNVVLARVRSSAITAVFAAVGEQGKPAERVAEECAALVQAYLDSESPVCEHLADQLLLPLALGAGGTFRTGAPSDHARTNADVIARFLGDRVAFSPVDGAVHVTVS